ncbi:MAG: SDR family NAD(P)-dependent oxidoreductase, partial [Planctomycetaceae bacterium]
MALALENHVILVTGGAKGIGAGIVELLAAEGAVPVIIGRNAGDNAVLARTLEESGGQSLAITAELTRTEDCQRAVDIALERFGQINGLVNNAGINDGISLEHGDTDQFLASLRRNLVHYYDMARF